MMHFKINTSVIHVYLLLFCFVIYCLPYCVAVVFREGTFLKENFKDFF